MLEKFCIDPKVLSVVEQGAMKIKVFGAKNTPTNNQKVTRKGDAGNVVWRFENR